MDTDKNADHAEEQAYDRKQDSGTRMFIENRHRNDKDGENMSAWK